MPWPAINPEQTPVQDKTKAVSPSGHDCLNKFRPIIVSLMIGVMHIANRVSFPQAKRVRNPSGEPGKIPDKPE
jgi:hypothetical protein